MKVRYTHPTKAGLPRFPVARLVGHEEGPLGVVRFTADGKYCFTGGHDRTLRLWNPSRLDPLQSSSSLRSSSLHHDVDVASLPRSLPLQSYEKGLSHEITALAVSDDSTRLISSSDRVVVIHDVVSTACERRWTGHVAKINAVAVFSTPRPQVFLSASYDATVRLWDARSGSPHPIQILNQATDSVTAVHATQPHPQEAMVQTTSVDGCLRTYDLRKGLLHTDDCQVPLTGMAVSPEDDTVVVNGLDGHLRVVEETGRLGKTFSASHVAGQYALECAWWDKDTIMTGSEDGNAVLYHLDTSATSAKQSNTANVSASVEPVQVLEGHQKPTCSVAATFDGRAAITVSYDGHAVVWAHNADYVRDQK